MTLPLWFVLLAIGLGLYGLSLMLRNLPKPDPRIDEQVAEDFRRAQIDAAFRTHGQLHNKGHIVRADFQRGNRA